MGHFQGAIYGKIKKSFVFRLRLYLLLNSSSTLILPRASASRASDVINMDQNSVFTTSCCLSRMCNSADGQQTRLHMPHALGLVVGRSIL